MPDDEPIHEAAPIGDKKATSTPLPATTTEQEDIVTAGQRRVNIMWEKTQRVIAIGIVAAAILNSMFIVIASVFFNKEPTPAAVQQAKEIIGLALLIIGFYFSRTNHTNTGGVGKKEQDQQR